MINSVELGKGMLQGMLPPRKMFLVLDDVMVLCISRRWFCQGSVIIITTIDVDLLRRLQVDHLYTMNAMVCIQATNSKRRFCSQFQMCC